VCKKLIEGAILYAKEWGFSPHRDYQVIKGIFNDVDSTTCPVKYEYGKESKPFYIRGQRDNISQNMIRVGFYMAA